MGPYRKRIGKEKKKALWTLTVATADHYKRQKNDTNHHDGPRPNLPDARQHG